ncbi:DNA repair protein XRCC1-like isoform X2 [Corticium candelabrum]|uniref:DNA repair protein XRCC1-like isoform X2 n=1 Tax=Corticium candelabrum TaxID=121492 RepID=UPI002E26AB8A|nr:DNA repair protein XRCC1-like isoform X2 [Corticium candelabrum]
MPDAKISHILSFSSEDSTHVAENLLKQENARKWNCANAGEKTASVILQLEKATKIEGIDIGNDGSAFVEVLVGRSGSQNSDGDYEVLLVTSSFMSPSESKSGANKSRVKMFGKQMLSKVTVDQKWDRVKIICTQPYNKNVKYGLVFVRLHGPPDESDTTNTTNKQQVTFGAFKLRDDVDTASLRVGSLFESQKASSPLKLSVAASARAASMLSDSSSCVRETVSTKTMESVERPVKILGEASVNKASAHKASNEPPAKKAKSSSLRTTNPSSVPFNEIMKGVRFAFSGFKNPYRGELRDKALALGAKYEPDWGSRCTHLVCAFPNTPKFNQVKAERGTGVIVQQEWIVDCYKRRIKLPSSRYTFDRPASDSSSESDSDNMGMSAIAKQRLPKASPVKQHTNVKTDCASSEQRATLTTDQQIQDSRKEDDGSSNEMSDQKVSVGSKETKEVELKPEQKTNPQTKKKAQGARIQYDTDSEDTDDEIRKVQNGASKESEASKQQHQTKQS